MGMTNTSRPRKDTPAVADIRAEEAADEALLFTRKQCMARGGWGQTSQISKENSGALHRLLDGSAVRITAKSFYAHLIDLASAVCGAAGPQGLKDKLSEEAPYAHAAGIGGPSARQ